MAVNGTDFDEARLLEKLRAIEALFAGATTVLRRHLDDVTQRIITAAIHQDVPDATESAPKAELGPGTEREP